MMLDYDLMFHATKPRGFEKANVEVHYLGYYLKWTRKSLLLAAHDPKNVLNF
jgi:hypothetical protein